MKLQSLFFFCVTLKVNLLNVSGGLVPEVLILLDGHQPVNGPFPFICLGS